MTSKRQNKNENSALAPQSIRISTSIRSLNIFKMQIISKNSTSITLQDSFSVRSWAMFDIFRQACCHEARAIAWLQLIKAPGEGHLAEDHEPLGCIQSFGRGWPWVKKCQKDHPPEGTAVFFFIFPCANIFFWVLFSDPQPFTSSCSWQVASPNKQVQPSLGYAFKQGSIRSTYLSLHTD